MTEPLETPQLLTVKEVAAILRTHPDARPLWTVEDLCRFLGVSKRWVHERTRRGEVPCYRFGSVLRFDAEEITAWAAKFHHSPGGG